MKPIPIFLDTDIGDDVDDALALAIILNSPELFLRGVTTVFRDAPRRALLAREVLRLFGRDDVPVAAGASQPLLEPYEAIPGGAHLGRQFEALGQAEAPALEPHAIDFLAERIRQAARDGERPTVVAIGPLTNIALLFARHPDTVVQCRLLVMGGYWKEPRPEWNIRCDPEAAAMVFRSGADITMVGLDVTLKCVLSDEQVARFREAGTPRATFLADLIALWNHPVTLHDPLTLLTLFDECVRFEEKCIQVMLADETRAHTVAADGPPNARVAVDVDVERAVSLFMQRALA